MAKVNYVKKAMKDISSIGVIKGEPYYWWKIKRGSPKQMSKTPPKRSQTTGSAFYAELWSIKDNVAELEANDALPEAVQDVAQRLRDLAEQCQESFDNMPEGLQQGDTGQLLEERALACEAAADELDNIDFEEVPEAPTDDMSEEAKEERQQEIEDFWTDKLQEVTDVSVDV